VVPRWLLREQVLSLALVLVVASLLRLPFPDLTPFGHDEALEAERARPIWYGDRPVDSEISSWWIPDPAGLLYYFSLAEAFPKPAIARVLLISATNVVTVMLCYVFSRRFFGREVGLLAGLLYAINPWAVMFGRQPWVITQPLLTMLMVFSAAMVIARQDRRWVVPFFVAGAAQTQTHQLAVVFGPPVLLTLVLFVRRWLVWQLVPAIVAAVAIVSPYMLHLWDLRDDIAEALTRGNRGLTLAPDGTAATLTVWLLSGFNLGLKLGFPDALMAALHGPLLVVAVVATGLLVAGITASAWAIVRRSADWSVDALLLIWLLAPLALMSWQSSQVYIHYVLCLVPVPFIVMARGASWLAVAGGRAWPSSAASHRAMAAVVGAVLLVQLAAIGAFYAAIDRSVEAPPSPLTPTAWQSRLNESDLLARQLGIGELHGLPLRYWQGVADQTRAYARGAGIQDVTVITGIQDDGARWLDKRRKALNYLLGPDLRPRFPLEGLVVVPTTQPTLFLTLPEEELPRLAQRAASRLAVIPFPDTNGATGLFQVRPRPPGELIPNRRPLDVDLGHGARLVGLDPPTHVQPGQTAPLFVILSIAGDDLHLIDETLIPRLDLLDGSGRIVTSTSRGGLPSYEWFDGDLLVQAMNLTAPVNLAPGDYGLRVRLADLDGIDDEPVGAISRGHPVGVLRVRDEP